MDADYAHETAEMTRLQVMQRAEPPRARPKGINQSVFRLGQEAASGDATSASGGPSREALLPEFSGGGRMLSNIHPFLFCSVECDESA